MEDVNNYQLLVEEIYDKHFKEGKGDFFKYAFYLLNYRTAYNEFIIIRAPINDQGKYEPVLKIINKGITIVNMQFPIVDSLREAEEMLVLWAEGYRTGFQDNHHYFKTLDVESLGTNKVKGKIIKVFPSDEFTKGSFLLYTQDGSGQFIINDQNRHIAPFGSFNILPYGKYI